MSLRWASLPRRLALARAAFLLVAGLSVALQLMAAPAHVRNVRFDWMFQESYPVVASILSPAAYARYLLGRDFAVAALCTLVGLFIGWRKADEGVAWLGGALLVLLPVVFGSTEDVPIDLPQAWRRLAETAQLVVALGVMHLMAAFVLLFPNGRPAARWLPWVYGLFVVLELALAAWPKVPGDTKAYTAWVVLAVVIIPIAVGAQANRYRRLSTPVERQQIKWVVAGLSGIAVLMSTSFIASWLLERTKWQGLATLLTDHALLLAASLLPLTLGFAILRYRLWDIDRLVRRTLLYTTLTGALAGLYLLSVILLQSGLRAVTGQAQSPVVTVLSTLLIAAAAGPLRGGVQRAIDRRFNRRRYDAAHTLEAFGAALRAEPDADLNRLDAQLVQVVQNTLEPESVSLWLRR